MKSKKNILYGALIILCAILEFSAFVGAYFANYFTRTRMGMLRHVVYLNNKWEKNFPILFIKIAVIVLIIALLIIAFIRLRKIKVNALLVIVTILLLIISAWTLYFIIYSSTKIYRSYYILSMCFVLASILQNIIYHCICQMRKLR